MGGRRREALSAEVRLRFFEHVMRYPYFLFCLNSCVNKRCRSCDVHHDLCYAACMSLGPTWAWADFIRHRDWRSREKMLSFCVSPPAHPEIVPRRAVARRVAEEQ